MKRKEKYIAPITTFDVICEGSLLSESAKGTGSGFTPGGTEDDLDPEARTNTFDDASFDYGDWE